MKYIFLWLCLVVGQWSFSHDDPIVDMGLKLLEQNKLEEAITFYNAHIEVSEAHSLRMHLFIGLAEVYKLKLNYQKAQEYYTLAQAEMKKSENKNLEFYYHVKIAEFYRKRTLFSEAANHLKKAEALKASNTIDKRYLAKFYGRKAALFTEYYFQPDSTFFYAEKSLQLSKELNDANGIFYATLEMSSVYEELREYDKAIIFLEDLITYANENNLVQNKVDAYINYTRILIKAKQYKKGLDQSLTALAYAKKNELLYGEIIITDNIRNTYEKLGDTDKALQYLKTRLKLTERYYELEHNKFLFELEEKYKSTERENQLLSNTLELSSKNKELETNKTRLVISSSLLFSTAIMAFLTAFYFKKAKRDNIKLQFLSQQNEFLLSEANHRINNNLQLVIILISDQLKQATEHNSLLLKNVLSKVETISTLHQHLHQNEDKEKIEIANYLRDVRLSFSEIFDENNIELQFKVEPLILPTNDAMYYGLLLTELFINSIKHAFEGHEENRIVFHLEQKLNILYFTYTDNGENVLGKTLKLKLIDKLCRQLKLEYKVETREGFKFSFVKEINNVS